MTDITKRKTLLLSALTAAFVLLSACTSHGSSSTGSPGASPANTTVPPTLEATATPDAAGTPASSGDGLSADNPSSSPAKLLELARLGKVKNSGSFTALQSMRKQVEQAWGKPDRISAAGQGVYAEYTKRKVTFGYTAKGALFDARSYDPELQKLPLSAVKQALGQPESVSVSGSDSIYAYKAGGQLLLKFVIPQATGTVDHISVYHAGRAAGGKGGAQPPKSGGYVLDVKGTSDKLSDQAWRNMVDWRNSIKALTQNYPGQVFLNGPDKKKVALTFDDGPDGKVTLQVADILNKYKVKGSFFFIGKDVQNHPDVVKKVAKDGHLVLNHSYNHKEMTKLSEAEKKAELTRTDDAIKALIGKKPAMVRPPYGDTDGKVVTGIVNTGHAVILWSLDTLDWSLKDSEGIRRNVADNVRNGDIILMHSSEEQSETAKALPLIIQELQKQNYEIVDLATLLGVKAYQ